jgi:DNA-binding FadR family transcriptional regulator
MKGSNELYKLVYEYYSARILFGFYSCGDTLPAIPKICRQFRMAIPTVRTAFTHLEQDGYIKVEASKAARVIYKTTTDEIRKQAAEYFLAREEGLQDIAQAGQILIEPLWEYGLQKWKEENWERLWQELTNPSPGSLFMPVELYILVLSSLENKLILNFYWEMVRYLCFPYLAEDRTQEKLPLEEMGIKTNEALIQYLKNDYFAKYNGSMKELFVFLEQARTEFTGKNIEPVPFQWNIYRQRPQMRYSLASAIIRAIIADTYPVGTYLPSLPRLAEEYGVAMSTVRRTVTLLNDLGVVKSHQGKGILVCMAPEEMDLSRPEVKGLLDVYLESLQMLVLSAKPVSRYTLQSVSDETICSLIGNLRQMQKEDKTYLYIETYLSFIARCCPSAMVRECYSKLKGILACGYPITLQRLHKSDLGHEFLSVCVQSEDYLEIHDYDGFVNLWYVFLEGQERQARIFIQVP